MARMKHYPVLTDGYCFCLDSSCAYPAFLAHISGRVVTDRLRNGRSVPSNVLGVRHSHIYEKGALPEMVAPVIYNNRAIV